MRPEITIAVLVLALLVHKIELMRPGAEGPVSVAIVQHDCAIFALLLLLYALAAGMGACHVKTKLTQAMLIVIGKCSIFLSLVVVLLYAADVYAYNFFATRLYASDLVTFSSQWSGALSILRSSLHVFTSHSKWKLAVDVVLMLALLRGGFLLMVRPLRPILDFRYLSAAAFFCFLFWVVPIPGQLVYFRDKTLFENFIERNHNFYVRNTFSDGFRARILALPPPVMECEPGTGKRLNIILVIVESLSDYQSRFFSGIEDWTPHLDGIAGRETALTNFYANGWSTDGGLVALLTGTVPLVPELRSGRTETFTPVGGMSLTMYLDLPRPLPRVLSEEDGYFTEFVAPGDITVFGQDKFLANIGFQRIIEGHDPRFAMQKLRGPFSSVPDRLFFQVALDEVARIPNDRPYFLVVQTFWSHPPYMDPNDRGKLHGPAPVFRDTDEQIGAFYEGLMRQGFFKNGLMFVTGDHRAMVPYQKSEFDRFGGSAPARIPGVIVSHAIALPRVITQDFQQRDFPASIEALVGKQYCLAPQQGSFLSVPLRPPSCIIQARGDDRDLVYVKCGSAEGTVLARGDKTRFVSGSVPDESAIIETINRTRVRPNIR